MKKVILCAILALTVRSLAEEVGVKIDKVDGAQDTTISIQKGKSATLAKKKYVLSEGEHELTGDKDVVAKSSELNWKTACKEWKQEFREDNKDNKIISITCGKMTCVKEGVETTCSSMAKYKVKTLSEE